MKKTPEQLKQMYDDELIVHCLERLMKEVALEYKSNNSKHLVTPEETQELIDELNSRKRDRK